MSTCASTQISFCRQTEQQTDTRDNCSNCSNPLVHAHQKLTKVTPAAHARQGWIESVSSSIHQWQCPWHVNLWSIVIQQPCEPHRKTRQYASAQIYCCLQQRTTIIPGTRASMKIITVWLPPTSTIATCLHIMRLQHSLAHDIVTYLQWHSPAKRNHLSGVGHT